MDRPPIPPWTEVTLPQARCPIENLAAQIRSDLDGHDVQIVGGCGIISRTYRDMWVWCVPDPAAVETLKEAAGVTDVPGWLMHVQPGWGDWEVWRYPGHS